MVKTYKFLLIILGFSVRCKGQWGRVYKKEAEFLSEEILRG